MKMTSLLLVAGAVFVSVAADFRPETRDGKGIQAAIDAAASAGGGCVTLEKGEYLSGTIYLKSNVELHIPEGCVLKGCDRWDLYDDVDDPRIRKVPEFSKKAFIACVFQENVAITGGGIIDGQGVRFYHETSGAFFKKPPHPRTRMIEFVGCRNVRFEDVTFKDSPGWTCWMRMCEDFTADRVKIHGDQRMINNDGFHIDGCCHVRLRKCDVRSGDDSVVMRAIVSPNGDSAVCEDLLVEDCTLDSACQAVRLGCPSDGTIRNAVFRNVKMSGRNGISSQHPVRYLQDGDSGNLTMENILFENCTVDCRMSALCFWVQEGIRLKSFGNVTFRNVELKGFGPLMLKGCEGTPLANLRFENVKAYVEAKEPLEVRHVEGFSFSDCTFSSWTGEHYFDAKNRADTWERVR